MHIVRFVSRIRTFIPGSVAQVKKGTVKTYFIETIFVSGIKRGGTRYT